MTATSASFLFFQILKNMCGKYQTCGITHAKKPHICNVLRSQSKITHSKAPKTPKHTQKYPHTGKTGVFFTFNPGNTQSHINTNHKHPHTHTYFPPEVPAKYCVHHHIKSQNQYHTVSNTRSYVLCVYHHIKAQIQYKKIKYLQLDVVCITISKR